MSGAVWHLLLRRRRLPVGAAAGDPARAYADPVLRVLALVVAALLLTGCSGSQEPTAAPSASPSAASLVNQPPPSCPSGPAGGFAWPAEVPQDLPAPPGAKLTKVEARTDGLTVVMFTTPTSIRESVLFLIEKMPAAGYTLARGDAENTEADAPFVKGDLRGVMRMIAVEACRTDWLMAVTKGAPAGAPGGGTPLLPPRPGASPLPFG